MARRSTKASQSKGSQAKPSQRSNRGNRATEAVAPDTNTGGGFPSTVSEQLARDVASFSFAAPVGSRMRIDNEDPVQMDRAGIPGIMVLRFVPTVGWADSPTSAVNVAARALMDRVRRANSGRRNYDQTDLMLYILGVDSAYAYLSYMRRLYGLCSLTNPQNKYVPEYLVQAAGADYQDLLINLATFRSYINTYALRLFSLPIPKIPLVSRHMAMMDNVYADDNAAKAQLYIFVPEMLYQYDYDTTTSTPKLVLNAVVGDQNFNPTDTETAVLTRTFAQIAAKGEAFLAPLLTTYGEEDFALMGGDILKAYGEEGVYRAMGVVDEYQVLPVYDEVMLHRIMNSTAFGYRLYSNAKSYSPNNSFDISVNVASAPVSSFLQSKPQIVVANTLYPSTDNDAFASNHVLNSAVGPMSPDLALESLAFATIPTNPVNTTGVLTTDLTTVGTEYITRYIVYYIDYTTTNPSLKGAVSMITPFCMAVTYSTSGETPAIVGNNVGDARDKLSLIEQFDFHPILRPVVTVLDADAFTSGSLVNLAHNPCEFFFGDISDYSVITPGDLERIRDIKTLVDLGL